MSVYFTTTPDTTTQVFEADSPMFKPVFAQPAQARITALTQLANADTAPGWAHDNYIALETLKSIQPEAFWALPEGVRDWVRKVEAADWEAQTTGNDSTLLALGFDNSSGAYYCQLSTADAQTAGPGESVPVTAVAQPQVDFAAFYRAVAQSATCQTPDAASLPG